MRVHGCSEKSWTNRRQDPAILWRAADLGEPKNRRVVVYCEHGPRAVLAREILSFMGYTSVGLLEGHMSGWRQQNLTTR